MLSDNSHLERVKLRDLRPTQISVGMSEVKEKEEQWKSRGKRERQRFLSEHWFPGVSGPGGSHYIIDHHHLALALEGCSVKHVRLVLLADLSALEQQEFWMVMDHRNWVHPYDKKGIRVAFSAIPKKISGLVDDPYRGLADRVRKMGGYAKSEVPFADFLWADFFRRRVTLSKSGGITESTQASALALASSASAKHLPGWSGIDRKQHA